MIVRVMVNLEIADGADAQEVVNECDYTFIHKDILAMEIVDMEEVE